MTIVEIGQSMDQTLPAGTYRRLLKIRAVTALQIRPANMASSVGYSIDKRRGCNAGATKQGVMHGRPQL